MDETLRRIAPLSGVAGAVLLLVGMLISMSGMPGFAAEAEEVAAYLGDEYKSIIVGAYFSAISAPFLIWFFACLRTGISRFEAGDRLATTAFGAGIATVGLLLAGLMIHTMGAIRADRDAGIDPASAIVFYDMANILFGAAAPAAFAAALAATAVAALRYRALIPSWLAVASLLLAVVCVIPPISWVGISVGILWIAMLSAKLYLQRATLEPV